MGVWEIDFYSRPILDEQQKKIWELLVCDSQRTFEFVKSCSGSEANSGWLKTALQEAMAQWQESAQLPNQARPEKIRFFRRPMQNMISRACKELEIPLQPSRRTFALYQWLGQRQQSVYPQQPGYQPLTGPPLQLEQKQPQPLPDALIGTRWQFVTLEAATFAEMDQWEISFGESLPLEMLAVGPDTPIPGLVIYSPRSVAMAGWMSGLEMAFLKVEQDSFTNLTQLLLETGGSDRWVVATLKNPQVQAEAQDFETAKQKAQQVHFLAVQSDSQSETFAGFWLLQEVNLA